MKINSAHTVRKQSGIMMTTCAITAAALLWIATAWPAAATTTTYTESFDSQSAFNTSTSDTFTYWADDSGMMTDTTQSIPAPYYYNTNANFFNIARSGQYLFGGYSPIATDGALRVFDTSTNTFTAVDTTDWGFTTFINEIAVNGNYVYMTWGKSTEAQGGLAMVDIGVNGTPTNPQLVRNFNTFQNATALHVAAGYSDPTETYVYVVSNSPNPYLRVIDVTDPNNPTEVGSVALPSGVTYTDLDQWNYLLLIGGTSGNELTAVNILNPTSPSLVTISNLSSQDLSLVYDIDAAAPNLLVAGRDSSGDGVLTIFSALLSGGILTLTQENNYTFSGNTIPEYLTTDGTYYYINSKYSSNTQRLISVFSISITGETISFQGSDVLNTPWGGDMVAFSNNVWVSNIYLGLTKINVSDPTDPGTPIYNEVTGGDGLDVALFNGELYVADGTESGNGNIEVIDITDPTAMSSSLSFSTGTGCSNDRLDVAEGYLWWVCGTSFGRYEEPWSSNNANKDTSASLNDIGVSGTVAYVADFTNITIQAYDVSATPFTLVGIESTTSTPQSVEVYGEYLFVATIVGVDVFDISNTSNPELIRSYNSSGTVYDMAVSGGYLYTIGSKLNATLISELIDPADSSPTEYSVDPISTYRRIEVNNGYAYIGSNQAYISGTLKLYNVRTPSSMTQVTNLPDALSDGDLTAGFAFADGWVFIADGGNNGALAVHTTHPTWQTVVSNTVDTTTDNIESYTANFTGILNGGSTTYYISNNGGATWTRVNSTSSDTVVGSAEFTTTGSDLRWKAVMYSDDDTGFEQAPVIDSVSISYTHNEPAVDTTPPTSLADPTSDTYSGPITVSLFASDDNPGTTIYYTTDGSTPTTSSTAYTTPITISTTTTLKFFAVDSSGNEEEQINAEAYVIDATEADTTAPVSVASVYGDDGPWTAAITVQLLAADNADPNPAIYYTLDGSEPTTSSTLYTEPILLDGDTSLLWYAVDASGNAESPIHEEKYVFEVDIDDSSASDATEPVSVAVPSGNTFSSSMTVTLLAFDNADPSPAIYYTLDDTYPSMLSFLYTGPITVTTDTTIKFFAVDASLNYEDPIHTETYIIGSDDDTLASVPDDPAADPTYDPGFVTDSTKPTVWADPEDGNYDTAQTVQLYANDNLDPNPVIYYTTDGTTPSIASFVYTRPLTITITITTTVKFFSRDASGNASAVASETYTITNTVTDSAAPSTEASGCTSGYFDIAQDITLTTEDDNDNNPAIYYTTDGSTPTRFSFVYRQPIAVSTTSTVSFFSRDASGNIETVQTIDCTVYDSASLDLKVRGKKKGKGIVRVINKKNNKVLRRFTAFDKKGSRPAIVKVGGVKRVAVVQAQKGEQIRLFDLNGNKLSQKRFAKKTAVHKIAAGNLYKGKKNGEIIVAQLNKTTGQLVLRAFTVRNDRAPRVRVKKIITAGIEKLIAKGYRLQIKKKKLLVKTLKGNKTQLQLRLIKKVGKWKLKVVS